MEKQQAVFDRMTLGNLWRRLRCHGAVEMTCRDLAKRIAELGLFQLHEYDDGASGAGRKLGPGWKLTAWPPETLRSATAAVQVQVGSVTYDVARKDCPDSGAVVVAYFAYCAHIRLACIWPDARL